VWHTIIVLTHAAELESLRGMMGEREGAIVVTKVSPSALVCAVLEAFVEQSRWSQAKLAERLGVEVRTLRKVLIALDSAERIVCVEKEDGASRVWQATRGLMGGMAVSHADVKLLMTQVRRAPKSQARERAMARLKRLSVDEREPQNPHALTPEEEANLELLDEAIGKRVVMWVDYVSHGTGQRSERHISPQRIVAADDKPRAIVFCHRDRILKWFRISGFVRASLESPADYVAIPRVELDTYAADSVNYFNDGRTHADAEESFILQGAAARWVPRNLPKGLRAQTIANGRVRITAPSRGIVNAARFVVGLGADVEIETPTLRNLVLDLASGALDAAREPKRAKRLVSSGAR
jgi:predicted DNA-binding transcriptional regulator YafY